MAQSRIGEFLIVLSGARPEVLDQCPTERIKFQSLGWALLITCGMATVSMWFALTSAMGLSPFVGLPFALIWGLVIIGIDRWLITSTPIDSRAKFLIAVPRLTLALLLGSLISTPLVLRIFESEINNQISIIKENSEASFLDSQQHSQVAALVSKWQNTVNDLEQVIDSNGAEAINPSADPEVQTLTTQLNTARQSATTDYNAWQCQLYGGCGAPKGSGPLAAASEQRYIQDEQQIAALTSQISQREKALQAGSANSQQFRLQQAKAELPSARAQLAAAQGEENALLQNFDATNAASNGLLIRLEALDQLSADASTIQVARILLFLLFLVIEILPVTVKLLQQPGNYERILRSTTRRELRQAEWILRSQPVDAADSDVLRPKAPGADFSRRSGRGVRDPLDDDMMQVWAHYRDAPVHGWESTADTAELERVTDDPAEPNQLDDALREMKDSRSSDGLDWHQDGIELRYQDEDQ